MSELASNWSAGHSMLLIVVDIMLIVFFLFHPLSINKKGKFRLLLTITIALLIASISSQGRYLGTSLFHIPIFGLILSLVIGVPAMLRIGFINDRADRGRVIKQISGKEIKE